MSMSIKTNGCQVGTTNVAKATAHPIQVQNGKGFPAHLQVIGAQYGGQSTTTTAEPSSTSASSATSSQSISGAVQSVDVGKNGFIFNPDTLTFSAGDKVEFHFYPGNHSVTQSSFDNPSQPLSDTSTFSGFVAPTSRESVRLANFVRGVHVLTINSSICRK